MAQYCTLLYDMIRGALQYNTVTNKQYTAAAQFNAIIMRALHSLPPSRTLQTPPPSLPCPALPCLYICTAYVLYWIVLSACIDLDGRQGFSCQEQDSAHHLPFPFGAAAVLGNDLQCSVGN